jgi:hypothetical protein
MEKTNGSVQLATQQELNKLITDKVGKLHGAQLDGVFTAFTDPAGFNYGLPTA